MADIHFGTDGWRAIIGEDFTPDNLNRVVAAAARIFKEEAVAAGRDPQAPGTLIVGHDCRQDAHAYAELAAQVAAGEGFNVLLTEDYCPTPRYSAGLWELVSMMPPTASSLWATDQHSVGVGQ